MRRSHDKINSGSSVSMGLGVATFVGGFILSGFFTFILWIFFFSNLLASRTIYNLVPGILDLVLSALIALLLYRKKGKGLAIIFFVATLPWVLLSLYGSYGLFWHDISR